MLKGKKVWFNQQNCIHHNWTKTN